MIIRTPRICGRGTTRFQVTVAGLIWLFAFMETILYFHATSLKALPDVDPLHHNVQVVTPVKALTRPASPCENLVKQHNNQLICATMHTLWDSFPPPVNALESAVNRALPNIIQRETTVTEDVIVLATHLGVQKLDTLLIQARWWGGPISASMYIKSAEEIDQFLQFVEEHEFTLRYTSFHVVLEKTELPYPHNILRNLAMEYLEGDFFVAADVDFIPTPDSHRQLVDLFKRNARVRQKLVTKTVMVLAAFERHMPKNNQEVTEDLLPRNKAEVIEMVKSKKGNGFHMAGSSAGHGPTDYEKWMANKTNDFYPIQYKTIFEPYILGCKRGIPRYWQDFRGYGYNKFSWFFEIDKAGYDFAVLRDFYVVHMNHPIPPMKKKNQMTDSNRGHWKKFKDYLSKQYAVKKKQ
mmetsp:Transcript_15052/g.28793  ORF Transcript_15052/g.28793 Transcript_15052/m.28793 type:complete len:408 (+) Transcript_15052:125-1348(+)